MFRDIVVVGSSLGSSISPSKGSTLFFTVQGMNSSYWVGLQYNQTAVAYSQDISDTTASLDIYCNAGHCILYPSQLDRTTDCSSPLAVCIAPSDAMKASPRWWHFQITCNFIPPSLVSEVCGIFRCVVFQQASSVNSSLSLSICLTWCVSVCMWVITE